MIPCDSTDTWVAAAYDQMKDVEKIEDPWTCIISKGKTYHEIRIPGRRKRLSVYRQFAAKICQIQKVIIFDFIYNESEAIILKRERI